MIVTQTYKEAAKKALEKEWKVSHPLALPRIEKVVLSVGTGKRFSDEKDIERVERSLARIAGAKPVRTLARKSIAGFKVREGAVVGVMATLRGKHMDDFIEKFVRITLPRVRDFRGIDPACIDASGNCTIGIREHIAFPEIGADEVDFIH